MGGGKKKEKKDSRGEPSKSQQNKMTPTQVQEDKDDFIEGVDDLEDDVRAQLPSQEHCMWLVNIIKIHAKKAAKDLLEEYKQSVSNQLKQDVHDLKQANGKLTEELDQYKTEITKLREKDTKQVRRMERLEHEYASTKSELKKANLKLDEFEQQKYQNSVQIVGLLDNGVEDDLKQLLKMTKDKLGIKIKPSDIEAMSRLGKKQSGKTRNLNVTFKDKSTRERVYHERKKLIQDKNPSKRIYINDCLTKHRQSVLYTCRQQVRAKMLYAAWSQGGNILIRKDEHSNIKQIHDHEDVRVVLEQYDTEGKTGLSNDGSSTITHLSNYSLEFDSDI